MADSAQEWREKHRLLVGGRDVSYFRHYHWWYRFTRRAYKPIRVSGRPITAERLTKILGNPFEED